MNQSVASHFYFLMIPVSLKFVKNALEKQNMVIYKHLFFLHHITSNQIYYTGVSGNFTVR